MLRNVSYEVLFNSFKVTDEQFHENLVHIITSNFHIATAKISDVKKANIILEILFKSIPYLLEVDVDHILKQFEKNHSLNRAENESSKRLGQVYKFYQKDAKLLWLFCSEVLKQ